MDDRNIVQMFWERNEQGIQEVKTKYGSYCYSIAYNILQCRLNAEECENDTYWTAWNLMPPQQPVSLISFLGRITRNLSLKKLRSDTALKRGGNAATVSFDELSGCIPAGMSFDDHLQAQELADMISCFLRGISKTECNLFVCRYWYCDSIKEISARFGFSQSKVKMTLLRTREKLRNYLCEEGVFYENN